MEFRDFQINHPSVSFSNGVDPVPASKKVEGNVTYHNEGTEGAPEYFEAAFWLSLDMAEGPIKFSNYFSLKTVVVGQPKDTPYQTISLQAAAELPAILREMAQQIESVLAEKSGSDGPAA